VRNFFFLKNRAFRNREGVFQAISVDIRACMRLRIVPGSPVHCAGVFRSHPIEWKRFMTTIAHLSDTHLGFSDLDRCTGDGVNIRENDMYLAFSSAVDQIIDMKPAAVVHTGDFFHRSTPGNRPMIVALSRLRKLADAKIPVIVIAGNHSTPRTAVTSPILEAFRSISGVRPIFSQRYERVELDGVTFHGVPHAHEESRFGEELARVEPDADSINVLMLHTSLGKRYLMEEYGERVFPDGRMDMLSRFEYVALGHWHGFQKAHGADNAWYSGATERMNDGEAGKERGFCTVKLARGESPLVAFHPLPVRPWHRFEIESCREKTVEEIRREISSRGGETAGEGAQISVYLREILPEQSAAVRTSWVSERFPGALAVNVRRSFVQGFRGGDGENPHARRLDEVFDSFLSERVTDRAEYRALRELALSFFDRYERERN
jgi:DNA repair exonuclease SbcCD nuclease subunit